MNVAKRDTIPSARNRRTALLQKKAYGWRMPFYEHRNVSRHRLSRAAIPADTLRQIEEDNALDVTLYAYGQKRSEAQVREYGPAKLARDLGIPGPELLVATLATGQKRVRDGVRGAEPADH